MIGRWRGLHRSPGGTGSLRDITVACGAATPSGVVVEATGLGILVGRISTRMRDVVRDSKFLVWLNHKPVARWMAVAIVVLTLHHG